jgi:hypothetical protein
MTTDYLRTRERFGVNLGNFQALQHRAVDMFVETELCKSMAILAAMRLGDLDATERKSAISAAKVQLSIGGRSVTQQAIQHVAAPLLPGAARRRGGSPHVRRGSTKHLHDPRGGACSDSSLGVRYGLPTAVRHSGLHS